MAKGPQVPDPLDPNQMVSLKNWGELPADSEQRMLRNVAIDCGWGRVLFAQTFDQPERIAETLRAERPKQRDIALYLREPQVVLSLAPQELFLDPSQTFRLVIAGYQADGAPHAGFRLRDLDAVGDGDILNRIYRARGMVPAHPEFYWNVQRSKSVKLFVAEDVQSGVPIGVVTGVDHVKAFNDPDNGSSLWSLAVDPQSPLPGVGDALIRCLVEFYRDRGRAFVDLSVMHTNKAAIDLYAKLGFAQIPVFCVKKKNEINERLFIGRPPEATLNVYARIIVDEARRRGIQVEVVDAEAGYFTLTLGGRSITCREALSELTTAVAMSRCDDKAVTRRLMQAAGLAVPAQIEADEENALADFLAEHGRVVVKPARGEQGRGISVDLDNLEDVQRAVVQARAHCERVVVEQFADGQDLRVIVIDYRVIAGAIRRPAAVQGDGKLTIRKLIEQRSRRRARATQGESSIPLDGETERCVRLAGHAMEDVLPKGRELVVRKTANLHTGGTIHDVTDRLHPRLVQAAIKAAQALRIPVVGLDFLVPNERSADYVIIEANERPGLANHEPQPTAERFIDLLFPETRAVAVE